VSEVETNTRIELLPSGEVLLSKIEVCGDYNIYYDLYRVRSSGSQDRLTECGRYRFTAPLADGRIIAIRVTGGLAEVVALNRDGAEERVLYRGAESESLTGVAASAGKVAVTSLRDDRWSLVEITDAGVSVLVSDGSIKLLPRYSVSGDEIYFVANYGKVENVWSWRRSDRRLARWSDALSGV